MSNWENIFTNRIAALQNTSSVRYDDLVQNEIMPAFESVRAFVTTGGFTVAHKDDGDSILSFRFSLSSDMYVDVSFIRRGPCEIKSTFHIHNPNLKSEKNDMEIVPLTSATEGWAKQQFRMALDEFVTAMESLIGEEMDLSKRSDTGSEQEGAVPAPNQPTLASTTL